MNNLECEKKHLHNDDFYLNILNIKKNKIDAITPEEIANAINGDCTICLCYGCRNFTHNYNKDSFKKQECFDYIVNYFSRDFNPDTDLCQCPSCRENRGEDNNKHKWKLSYNGIVCYINEYNLPEAKSYAINKGIYDDKDYPYIEGTLMNDE